MGREWRREGGAHIGLGFSMVTSRSCLPDWATGMPRRINLLDTGRQAASAIGMLHRNHPLAASWRTPYTDLGEEEIVRERGHGQGVQEKEGGAHIGLGFGMVTSGCCAASASWTSDVAPPPSGCCTATAVGEESSCGEEGGESAQDWAHRTRERARERQVGHRASGRRSVWTIVLRMF